MTGLLLGLACGAIEFYLLYLLVQRISDGKTPPFWIIPAKLGVLALFFAPCAVFVPEELLFAASGTAGILVFGSIARFVFKTKEDRKDAAQSAGSGEAE